LVAVVVAVPHFAKDVPAEHTVFVPPFGLWQIQFQPFVVADTGEALPIPHKLLVGLLVYKALFAAPQVAFAGLCGQFNTLPGGADKCIRALEGGAGVSSIVK
jgi:hypothetical protein